MSLARALATRSLVVLPPIVALAASASAQDPLYTLESPYHLSGSGMGGAIAAIGDVNADGVPDFAVSASANSNSWFARVYSGASGALLFEAPVVIIGTGGVAGIGAAGDKDLDGVPDIAMARWDNNGPNSELRFHSGAGGGFLAAWHAPAGTLAFGQCVAPMGDLDSDGFPDTGVGSAGGAFVVSGATNASLFSSIGSCTGQIARGPDLDGDGVEEIVLGDTNALSPNPGAQGAIHFFKPDGTLVQDWVAGPDHFQLGLRVARVGDVDGDGHAEIAASAYSGSYAYGQVDVYSPKRGASVWTRLLPPEPSSIAISLASSGDTDGDGFPDVVAGEANSYLLGGSFVGGAFVLDGRNGTLLNYPMLTSLGPHSNAGRQVAMLGDVDADGASDVGITAPGMANVGPQYTAFGGAVALSCRASHVLPFGAGCPGSGGFVPQLTGSIGAGNAVTLQLTQALGNTTALFVFGNFPADVKAGGQCRLLLQPVLSFFIATTTTGAGPGTGTAVLAGSLPAGVQQLLMTQVFVSDPSMPATYSATRALQVAIH